MPSRQILSRRTDGLLTPRRRTRGFRAVLPSLVAAVALVMVGGAGVTARAAMLPPPPHPTVLSAEYQGQAYPVLAAEKDRPVVRVAGANKVLGATAPLQTARAARYHPVRVRVDTRLLERTRYGLADLSGRQVPAQDIKVSVDLTAEADVADAYLLVICEDRIPAGDRKSTPVPPTLRLQAVGELKAGETTRVAFVIQRVSPQYSGVRTQGPAGDSAAIVLYPHVFSEGIELRTNLSDDAASFHHGREVEALKVASAAWLRENAHGDRGLQPFLQIPPLLSSKDGVPASVLATLSIGADGLVSEVVLDPALPPDPRAAIESALGGWLFLPAVKAGKPVATRIRVPLKF